MSGDRGNELDCAEVRDDAELILANGARDWTETAARLATGALALLSRLDTLEAERDKYKRAHEVVAGFANNKLIPRAVAAEAQVEALTEALEFIAGMRSFDNLAQARHIAAEALSRVSRSEPAPLDEREERRRKWAYGSGPDTLNG